MENVNFVKNGVSRLPPGFRFQPTDEEIVFQYLKSKVFSFPLPASIIPEINVSNYDPWDLPGNCDEQERYFFSCKEGCRYRNGSRMNRTTKSGYWKATGSDKRISSSSCDDDGGIVGIRKTLVFYKGKSPDASKTHWVLHEYRLATLHTNATSNSTQNCVNGIGDWVLCRLLVKNRNNNNNVQNDGIGGSSSSTHHHHHHMMHNNNNNNNKSSSSSVVRGLLMMPSAKAHSKSSSSSSSCSSSTNFMEEVSSYDHADTSGRYHHYS